MKILQINTVINTGSTGKIAEQIGKIIIENEGESFIAYGRYGNPSLSTVIKIGKDIDIYIHLFKSKFFDAHGFGSISATNKFIEKVKIINPDIIHLHNIHGYYLNIEIFFNFLNTYKVPVIWTFHDCWPVTGHCVHFMNSMCDRWKTGCFSCPEIKSYPSSLFYDNSKSNYTKKKELFNLPENITLVPVSKWMSDVLSDSFLNKYPINQIYNGIDLKIFRKKNKNSILQKKIKGKFAILGVSSNWNLNKGFDDFIKLSNVISHDKIIILIGLSREQIKGLPLNVIGLERIENQEELVDYYNLSDVFVNLTREDNFPSTNLEAIACGTPVITYNTGGSAESIDCNTGFIIEQGNLENLNKKIVEVAKKGKTYFSDNCIKRANQYYNMNDRFKDYYNLYLKIMKE